MRGTAAVFRRVFTGTGALLFVLSLAYFLFTYLIEFGRVAAGGEPLRAVLWNVSIFTGFALHHSVFARPRFRRLAERVASPQLERSVYVWVASVLFVLVCASWQPIAGVAWDVTVDAAWLLRGVQAGALWLIVRSAAVLDIWQLAGTTTADAGSVTEFKATGPYGWVRHPIYAGWFLFVFAAVPMTMTRLVFAIVSCAYLLIAIPFEERTMRAAGGAYERYMRQVPWRLVPRVY